LRAALSDSGRDVIQRNLENIARIFSGEGRSGARKRFLSKNSDQNKGGLRAAFLF
jgi:hypothetical protein